MNNAQQLLTADTSGFGLLSLHPYANEGQSISLQNPNPYLWDSILGIITYHLL